MAFKTALFWNKLKNSNKKVQCKLCPHFCVIENGEIGKCRVRQNVNVRLVSLVYGKPCSIALDPLEKKPLYHFLPSSQTFSLATVGCNLSCLNCQNADISQASPNLLNGSEIVSAKKIIGQAKKSGAKSISYTYSEPTIFYEYMHDIAQIAKKENIKNITVTNGFINPEPLKQLCNVLDASNIDLKSMSDDFYKKVCNARLQPVLDSIKLMHEKGVWIEITNLIIPTLNDSIEDIRKLIIFVRNELGVNVPLHFTAFWPTYKLSHLPATSTEILKKARKTAMQVGLNYVYTGNINDYPDGETTFCPNCKKPVIKRKGFFVVENKLKDGKCPCGEKIPGVWG